MFRRFGIFKGILLSYILILCLPISIFFVCSIDSISDAYYQRTHESWMARIEQSAELLDLRLRECRSIASKLSETEQTSKYNVYRSTYDTLQALNILKLVKGSNEFLFEVGVYYYGDEYYATSNGVTREGIMYEGYNLDSEQKRQFWQQLNQRRISPTMLAVRNNRLLCYLVPIPYSYGRSNGVVAFMLDTNGVQGLFPKAKPEDEVFSLILNADGEVIFGLDDPDMLEPELFEKIVAGQSFVYKGRAYGAYTCASSVDSGWYVSVLVPANVLKPGISVYIWVLLVLSLLTLSCMLLAAWFTIRMWTPIREMGSMLIQDDIQNLRWEPLHGALRDILADKTQVEGKLEAYYQDMRENLLLRLIQGHVPVDTGLLEQIHRATGVKNCTHACVLAVALPETDCACVVINHLISCKHIICVVEIGVTDCLLVGLFFDGDTADDSLVERTASGILMQIRQAGYSNCHIGVGAILPLERTQWSYLQACSMLREEHNENFSICSLADSHDNGEQFEPEMREKEMIYSLALSQGNAALALQMINELLDMALKNAPSMYRYTCFCLISRTIKGYEEEKLGDEQAFRARCMHLVEALEACKSNEFVMQIKEIVLEIADCVQEMNRLKEDQYARSIEGFIRDHYEEREFSLDMLAETFGFSSGYWGRFVKERLGQNFLDIVWQLRLNRAKQLLRTTDMTVNQVVEAVGYLDARSFIRKFKSSEGITPGQYARANHKNGAEG